MRNLVIRTSPAGKSPGNRQGTTLVEVLMSVMLMGIGVVTLATLFPVAITRAVKATQLTNATNLRYNAEALLDVLTPNPVTNDGTDPDELPRPANTTDPTLIGVIDPIGYYKVDATLKGALGNDGAATPAPVNQVKRIPGIPFAVPADAAADEARARSLGLLPDSWVNILEEFPQTTTALTTTFASDVDLSDIPVDGAGNPTAAIPSQIILFSNDGKTAETRSIANITGQTVTWTAPLPTSFTVFKARIQTREERYTWMATVRKDAGATGVDMVVFFRREFSDLDEQIFSGTTGGRQAFVKGSKRVQISYENAKDQAPPFLTKGGFLFDAQNGFWYRILNYTDDDYDKQVTVELDQVARDNSNLAIFMRGIVDVYPIGS